MAESKATTSALSGKTKGGRAVKSHFHVAIYISVIKFTRETVNSE